MAGDDDNIIRFPPIEQFDNLDDLDAELEKLHAGRRQLGHYTLAGRTPVKVETLKAWVEEVAQRGRIAAETGVDAWRCIAWASPHVAQRFREWSSRPPRIMVSNRIGGPRRR